MYTHREHIYRGNRSPARRPSSASRGMNPGLQWLLFGGNTHTHTERERERERERVY